MPLKLTILTIVVTILTVLSVYGVYRRPAYAPVNFALTNAADNPSFNSQTAYLLSATEPNAFPIRRPETSDPILAAKSYLLYETKNDKVILSRNPRQPLPVASLTKILTAILVLENISLEEVITIDASSRNVDKEGADFYLGDKIYAKDLLGAMLVKSSNDAAVALAKRVEEKTGGRFQEMMNHKAYAIGMVNSSFFDPAGLNDDGYSTAEDLLKLIRYSKKYPEIWQRLGSKSLEINPANGQGVRVFTTTNKLFDTFVGIVGGKTGYTDSALGCMILEVKNSAVKDGSLLAIVLGSPVRFDDIRRLIEWGQSSFRWE